MPLYGTSCKQLYKSVCVFCCVADRQTESVTYGLPGNATAPANATGSLNATGTVLPGSVEPVANISAPYDFLEAATPGGPNTPSNDSAGTLLGGSA
jgi:hypothetical protein